MLPMLPILTACAWYGLAPLVRRPLVVFGLLAAVHLGQSAAYWLWIDAPRAYQANQNWAVVDRIVKEIHRDPGQVAIADAAESDCQGLWLELDWCYQLREFKEHPGPHVIWVVEPAGKRPLRGFSIRQVDGPVQLLCRDAATSASPRDGPNSATHRASRRQSLTRRLRSCPSSRFKNGRTRRHAPHGTIAIGRAGSFPEPMCGWELCSSSASFPGRLPPGVSRGVRRRLLLSARGRLAPRGPRRAGPEYLNINVYPMVLIGLHRMGSIGFAPPKCGASSQGQRSSSRCSIGCGECSTTGSPCWPSFSTRFIRGSSNQRWNRCGKPRFGCSSSCVSTCFGERRRNGERGNSRPAACHWLALHTRIEAWFLLAPLGVWMGMSWWQSRAARPRLVLGTLLCLAITPLFIFTVNVTLLAHHYQWELGRLSPFLLVEKWIHAPVTNELAMAPPAPPASRPTAVDIPIPQPNTSIAIPAIPHAEGAAKLEGTVTESVSVARQYFREMARTLGVVFLVLTGIVSCAAPGVARSAKSCLGRAHACRAAGDLGACE